MGPHSSRVVVEKHTLSYVSDVCPAGVAVTQCSPLLECPTERQDGVRASDNQPMRAADENTGPEGGLGLHFRFPRLTGSSSDC